MWCVKKGLFADGCVAAATRAKEARMFEASMGGGVAASSQYRHGLVAAISELMAPLFRLPTTAGAGRR
jgi:hypothetical protein